MARSETGGTKQELDADTPVENLKIVNQKYAYHPDPNKLRTPDGQIVDFVVAQFERDRKKRLATQIQNKPAQQFR